MSEILVHLSAPGSKKDEQGYKDMALAYQSFVPQSQLQVTACQANQGALFHDNAQPLLSTTEMLAPSEHGITDSAATSRIQATPYAAATPESQKPKSSLNPLLDDISSGQRERSSLQRISDSCGSSSNNRTSSPLDVNSSQAEQNAGASGSGCYTSQTDKIMPPNSLLEISPAPETFVTPKLREWAELLDFNSRYRPIRTVRPIDPLERGYWRIDTSAWSSERQDDFWSFLEREVGSGDAGPGVMCSRLPSGDEARSKTIVRIYCPGEIVGYVYLLAFVASESKASRARPVWIDAQDKVVIEMPRNTLE